MPDNIEDNPDMAAINALIEESTPEERALSFKDQGNRALKTGLEQRKKFFLRQAIEQYTEGLTLQCADAKLHSLLFSNRAHVNLLLGNFGNALLDAKDAVRFDPVNIKAHYRAAKSALNLRKYDECRKLCLAGFDVDPDNPELSSIQKDADKRQLETEAAEKAEQERQYNIRAPARKIADALLSRGWKIGRPQFGVGDRKPFLDILEGNEEEVRWPVLLFYPEASMQNDAIESFGEYDLISAHLDVMFDPEAPPLEWDTDRQYTRDNIEVYYLSYAAKPMDRDGLIEAMHGGWPNVVEEGPERYGPTAAQWVRVDENLTLGELLCREDHVAPGIPVMFVLAKNTPFKTRFLSGDVPMF
jgi:tetratricopeptide (TPR) repeat protein